MVSFGTIVIVILAQVVLIPFLQQMEKIVLILQQHASEEILLLILGLIMIAKSVIPLLINLHQSIKRAALKLLINVKTEMLTMVSYGVIAIVVLVQLVPNLFLQLMVKIVLILQQLVSEETLLLILGLMQIAKNVIHLKNSHQSVKKYV